MIHRLRQWPGFSCTGPIVIPHRFTIPASGLLPASAAFNRRYLVVPLQDGHSKLRPSPIGAARTASCMHGPPGEWVLADVRRRNYWGDEDLEASKQRQTAAAAACVYFVPLKKINTYLSAKQLGKNRWFGPKLVIA